VSTGRHRASTRLAVLAAPTLLLVPVLAACGGDPEGSDETTAPAVEESAAASDTAGESSPAATTYAADSATAAEGDSLAAQLTCEETQGAVVAYSEPIPDPNFAAIEATIQNVLDDYGAELTAVNANLDPGKQISDVQTLIQQEVDVILINPVAPEPVFPAFDAIRAADIPLIVQDTVRGGPFLTNVTADVEAAAAEGARILGEEVGDGQVAAIIGPEFAEVLVREAQSFEATATEVGLDVVDTQTNQQITPDGARQITDAWKQQYGGDLAGLWTFNDTSAVGAASAFDDTFRPVLVSINGQPEAIPLVEGGDIRATFDLQQDKIGQALAYAALAAICEVELPPEIVVPAKLIDADNVGDWRPLDQRTEDPFQIGFEERDGRTYLVTE
jgi:ribose transport system substrate-binding protein